MHILHRILVHLPGDVPASEGESRGEYLDRIRFYAETETEDFHEIAFDWRETATAGSWSDEYPENVLLGSEDGKRLIRKLKKVRESQAQEIRCKSGVSTQLLWRPAEQYCSRASEGFCGRLNHAGISLHLPAEKDGKAAGRRVFLRFLLLRYSKIHRPAV